MNGVGITYLWTSKTFPPFIRLEGKRGDYEVYTPERTCHIVPHGYCIANGEKTSCRCWSCSECSYGWHVSDNDRQYRFCPNCGAKVEQPFAE